jgi:glyoxylase-like metal-dependent hydrolase (beta-lactamase superfamily II)
MATTAGKGGSASAAAGIHPIPVRTPFNVGRVLCYLIEDEPLTLVDCGPDSEEAREDLLGGLAALGYRPEQLGRIVLTHAHHDHVGLAAWLQERSGAPVLLHPADWPKLLDHDGHFLSDRARILAQAGCPERLARRALQSFVRSRPFLGELPRLEPLLPGTVLEGERFRWQVLHAPGHASGHVVLWSEAERILLAGDTLLPHLTPAPIVELAPGPEAERTPTLHHFLASLTACSRLAPRLVLPGHGRTFPAGAERATALVEEHRRMLDRIERILRELPGGATAFEVSRRLYRGLKGADIFLALSETLAHLDALVAAGRAALEPHPAGDQFSPVRRSPSPGS